MSRVWGGGVLVAEGGPYIVLQLPAPDPPPHLRPLPATSGPRGLLYTRYTPHGPTDLQQSPFTQLAATHGVSEAE